MKKAAHPLNITDVVAAVLRQSAPNGCQFHEKMVIDPTAVTGTRRIFQEHGAGEAVEG